MEAEPRAEITAEEIQDFYVEKGELVQDPDYVEEGE